MCSFNKILGYEQNRVVIAFLNLVLALFPQRDGSLEISNIKTSDSSVINPCEDTFFQKWCHHSCSLILCSLRGALGCWYSGHTRLAERAPVWGSRGMTVRGTAATCAMFLQQLPFCCHGDNDFSHVIIDLSTVRAILQSDIV